VHRYAAIAFEFAACACVVCLQRFSPFSILNYILYMLDKILKQFIFRILCAFFYMCGHRCIFLYSCFHTLFCELQLLWVFSDFIQLYKPVNKIYFCARVMDGAHNLIFFNWHAKVLLLYVLYDDCYCDQILLTSCIFVIFFCMKCNFQSRVNHVQNC
jgi:hypothetical protein